MAKKLLQQVRDKIRLKQHSINTEKIYVHWVYRAVAVATQKQISQ